MQNTTPLAQYSYAQSVSLNAGQTPSWYMARQIKTIAALHSIAGMQLKTHKAEWLLLRPETDPIT